MVSGLRWPHGRGGGEWFPGIWKTREGEAGSELAARDTRTQSRQEGQPDSKVTLYVRRPKTTHPLAHSFGA